MKLFFEQLTDRLTVFQLPSYSLDYNQIDANLYNKAFHEI
jgi:hypothetical protein